MKILVISLAGIGDTLFATPLIHELRANFPQARIDALVLWPGARDLLKSNPHLNEVYQHDLIRAGYRDSLGYLRGLKRNGYDVSLNTHPQSRVHYRVVAFIVGARRRLGHDYGSSRLADRVLMTQTIPQDYGRHCIENNLDLLRLLEAGRTLPAHDYEIYFSKDELAWVEQYAAEAGLASAKVLGLHVGSGGTKNLALRRWPVESYIGLLREVTANFPRAKVLLFGGPEEKSANEEISRHFAPATVLLPRTPGLRHAAALVRKCDAFLSVDTAFMHLAAAAKVAAQIVIETPTWNRPIEPYNQAFTLVENKALPSPNLKLYCYDGKPIQGRPEEIRRWMSSVGVAEVYEAVARSLQDGKI